MRINSHYLNINLKNTSTMKRKILISSALFIVMITALIINQNIFSKTESLPYPTFQVTVYQTASSTPQANVRVRVYNSSDVQVETAITNSSGIVSWPWTHPTGDYTVKVWYPDQPNDGQNGQRVVTYSGADVITTVTLGPVY